MRKQHHILPLPPAGETGSPGEIATLADIKHPAKSLDREVLLRPVDEFEPHRLPSLAKKAVARFRISRS
jgi:hypothetical protein